LNVYKEKKKSVDTNNSGGIYPQLFNQNEADDEDEDSRNENEDLE